MKTIIKTSETDWLEKSLNAYSKKLKFKFVDDQGLGLTVKDLKSAISLMKAAKSKGGITIKQIMGALVGIGISAAGAGMIILAVLDPEPTTKLSLLVGGGVVIILTGGYGALRALGIDFNVTVNGEGVTFNVVP